MFHSYTRACNVQVGTCRLQRSSHVECLSGRKVGGLTSEFWWVMNSICSQEQKPSKEQWTGWNTKGASIDVQGVNARKGPCACWCLLGGGGVGWGELYNNVHLHFRTYVMLRYCAFSCTFTHTSCYATVAKNWHRQRPQQTSRTLWLKNRAKLLQEGPGSRSDSFVVVKHTDFPFWGNPSIENEPLIWSMKLKICKIPQFWTFNKS